MVGEDKTKFRERKEEILERSILHSYILNIIKLKKKKKILHLFFHRNTKFSRTNDFPPLRREKEKRKERKRKRKEMSFPTFPNSNSSNVPNPRVHARGNRDRKRCCRHRAEVDDAWCACTNIVTQLTRNWPAPRGYTRLPRAFFYARTRHTYSPRSRRGSPAYLFPPSCSSRPSSLFFFSFFFGHEVGSTAPGGGEGGGGRTVWALENLSTEPRRRSRLPVAV